MMAMPQMDFGGQEAVQWAESQQQPVQQAV
jgi:hypothetical protein